MGLGKVFVNVRGGRIDDANELIDIDLKCFDHAWAPDEWTKIGHSKEHAISVVTFFGTVVGFAVFKRAPNEAVELLKLAVKPAHRRKGVSLSLVAAVMDFAMAQRASHIFTIVPESMVYPGPNYLSPWLTEIGFKPTKPFIKDYCTNCGEPEDGVKFVASVREIKQ